ncbi:MAG: DNA primase [Bacteroidetes bacterium SB0668_bin_1]|nr:DNA primase [Bacteroidetes bacterium SB0668_bin_1]
MDEDGWIQRCEASYPVPLPHFKGWRWYRQVSRSQTPRILQDMHTGMYFSDDTIAEVRAASDIVDVVSDYVRLKKKGSNFFGLCPFHEEKTPSFSVNPELEIFKCFGCGAGGDVFRFVMEVEGMSFPESVRTLAEKAGIELPEEGATSRERADAMEAVYGALRFAARFFYGQLTQADSGRKALEYMQRRGYSNAIIREFGVGYAPEGWNRLLKEAEAKHISPETLEQAGLIIPQKSGEGHYDRYRGRVMFPIFSHMGKVLGFGGRVLDDAAGEGENPQPKYINSPETLVYDKRRVLYGLHQARQVIREQEEAMLVEGYTDVMSLHQAGARNAVASCGTSLTREQVQLLHRYAQRIVLVFDADGAGEKAARRAIDLVLAEGMSVYVVELPAGEDPDSIAQREGASLNDYLIKHRVDFVRWLHGADSRAGRLDTPEGRAAGMRTVLRAIACIPDALTREAWLPRASEMFSVPEGRLYNELERMATSRQREEFRRSGRTERPSSGAGRQPTGRSVRRNDGAFAGKAGRQASGTRASVSPTFATEKILIRLMFEQGLPMVTYILGNTSLNEFSPGASRRTVEGFAEQHQAGSVNRQAFLDGAYGADVQQLVTEVAVRKEEPSENWEQKRGVVVPRLDENAEKAARQAMKRLKIVRVDEAIARTAEEQSRAEASGDDIRTYQQDIIQLQALRRRLEKGEVIR